MSDSAKAREIPFDQASDHHDGNFVHNYCPECNVCKDCTEKAIAAALREYGEAEYQRGRSEAIASGKIVWETDKKKADAEGYARGRKDAKSTCDHEGVCDECIDKYQTQGYRRGIEDCITQMHIEIQTLKERGEPPFESELRRRINNLRALLEGK